MTSQIFHNEPFRDFSNRDQREAFSKAIEASRLPQVANDATIEDVEKAASQAHQAFQSWRDRAPDDRANIVRRAADIMRSRRDELAGLIIREAQKCWADADAEVYEAIDFCEFYANRSIELLTPKPTINLPGEDNLAWHEGRGVSAIISPWNFPLSICCGMTVASLVTGNCAIVKPAEQTPAIAKVMCDIIWEAGVPREVLHFLPGIGETVGAALVKHPLVANIAFTGSRDVGLQIIAAASQTRAGQPFVKRALCEMGGKNAIIIDSSADMDEAVLGVRASAFGYAGQKCSACSRVIALDDVFDSFLSRLIESTRSLAVGDPMDASTDLGPVIDDAAAAKIREYIEIGKSEARLVLSEPPPPTRKRVPGPGAPGEGVNARGERVLGVLGEEVNAPGERMPAPGPPGEGVSALKEQVLAPGAPDEGTLKSPPPVLRGRAREGVDLPKISPRLVSPHIFAIERYDFDDPPCIATDEIFGPVLTVIRAANLDEALAIANASSYKLTGGCFSRTPSTLARVRREFRVGNLYINRGITGALVARQPFGGFALSGVGAKAGGEDYLRQFTDPRICTENTLRRGFVPESK